MNLYKEIPQVAKILQNKDVFSDTSLFSFVEAKEIITSYLEELRMNIKTEQITSLTETEVMKEAKRRLQSHPFSLHKVINGTGTILHTNLGRAPLSTFIADHVYEVMTNYTNLEIDEDTNVRMSRLNHIKNAFSHFIGAEAVTFVNNNAASLLLIANTFSKDKELVISRGELVEIGDGFRIRDILESAGAVIKEVGATNRTTIKDYKQAITKQTGLILKVKQSNFIMQGYTEEVQISDLKQLDALVVDDLGTSTSFVKELTKTFEDSLKQGSDLVMSSGDKLLGGLQVGIIAGKKDLINQLNASPMMRALRLDKVSIAATEALLKEIMLKKEPLIETLYITSIDELKARATVIEKETGAKVIQTTSTFGGGTLPLFEQESVGLVTEMSAKALRERPVPIFTREKDNQTIIDLRCVYASDDNEVIEALKGK